MKKAKVLHNWGEKWHVKLDPPLKDYCYGDSAQETYEYVIVSASRFVGEETYIFPANEQGQVTSWSEMPGSQKGTLSHKNILEDLGYEVEH